VAEAEERPPLRGHLWMQTARLANASGAGLTASAEGGVEVAPGRGGGRFGGTAVEEPAAPAAAGAVLLGLAEAQRAAGLVWVRWRRRGRCDARGCSAGAVRECGRQWVRQPRAATCPTETATTTEAPPPTAAAQPPAAAALSKPSRYGFERPTPSRGLSSPPGAQTKVWVVSPRMRPSLQAVLPFGVVLELGIYNSADAHCALPCKRKSLSQVTQEV
jgi:hypothetical protein